MLIGSKQIIESILNLQLNIVIESKPVKQVIKCKIRSNICRGKVTLKI